MNCIIVDDEMASRQIINKLCEKTPQLNVVKLCESAFEAVDVLKDEAIDLMFLDIQMPEMSGLDLLDALREPPQIILITGNADYAVDAFRYDVADYLVKPVTPARFMQAVQKAQLRYEQQNKQLPKGDYLFIRDGTTYKKVLFADIVRVEAFADYMMIYTAKSKYMVLTTMVSMEKKLPAETFMRIHRSHLISLDWLEGIEDTSAIVNSGIIPIGTTYRNRLLNRLTTV